ncbi:MAG: hypothetical protein ACYDAO_00755 [Thermoplasmataceae archaeon]
MTMDKEKTIPRNFQNPDPLNCGLEGKSVTVTLVNGRIESGLLKVMGQFSISMELSNKKTLIINKSGIMVVTVL